MTLGIGAGEPLTVTLDHARPNAEGFLVVVGANLSLPITGGVLVPNPDALVPPRVGAHGSHVLQTTWPAGLAPGSARCLQSWVLDPARPQGLVASNALTATQLRRALR